MASYRFDLDAGQAKEDVAISAQSDINTKRVRVVGQDDLTREEFLVNLEKIKQRILEIDWPTAV